MDVFFNGFIPQSLMECQHEHVTLISEKPLYRHLWCQHLIQMLHTHGLTLWKSRSKFVHDHTNRTHEQHIREEAYRLMISLRRDPSKPLAPMRHLTKRPHRYFFKTDLHNINAWSNRVQAAIKTKTQIGTTGARDIRRWCSIQTKYTPDFKKDNPDYDSDATEKFYVDFPDENKLLNIWNQTDIPYR